MASQLRVEELQIAAERYIVSVTSTDGQKLNTNDSICEEFRKNFQELFISEPGLSLEQFHAYLADFPFLEKNEAAGCEGDITEAEVGEALGSGRSG